MNISAVQYIDFDESTLTLSLNASDKVHVKLRVDDGDEADKTFAVEMRGPNVGDGITRVNITIIDHERKYKSSLF